MGLFGGQGGSECKQTWRKPRWNVSAGLKRLKIAKRKVELKQKKTWKCESEGKRCAWGDFTSRKTRRMHRETASEMASLPWSQNNRKENAAHKKVSTRGPGSFWSYSCTKNTTTCTSRHNSRRLLDLSPKQSINERALSLGPRLSLFFEVSYMESYKVVLTNEWVEEISWYDHSNKTSLPVLWHGTICFSTFKKGRNYCWTLILVNFGSEVPCARRFLSCMAFSVYEVIRGSCLSRSWFVYAV